MNPRSAALAESTSLGRSVDAKATTSRSTPLTPSIFHETWWLDAITGGDFKVVEVTAGQRIVGRMPVYLRSRFGIREMRMPYLTPFLGPAVDEGEGTANNRFLKRHEITLGLIDKLPRVSSQYIKCHRGVLDVVAFQERGFRTYVQFTHEIEVDTEDSLWRNMRNKTRNAIRRATEQLSVTHIADPSEFVCIYERNLAARGLRNELDFTRCREAMAASIERGRGRILAACDDSGKIVAANFCVWDETSTFYLLSTRSHNAGNGAISLLIWEAIKICAGQGLRFDLAGLGNQGSVLLYSGFGGTVSPRFVAVRTTLPFRLLAEARTLLRPDNYFY
jgi:hypothetical protein